MSAHLEQCLLPKPEASMSNEQRGALGPMLTSPGEQSQLSEVASGPGSVHRGSVHPWRMQQGASQLVDVRSPSVSHCQRENKHLV